MKTTSTLVTTLIVSALLFWLSPELMAQTVAPQAGAGQKFSALFFSLKNFALIVLAIGGLIAGVLFMINQRQFIIGVLMGTVIVASILFLMGLLVEPF